MTTAVETAWLVPPTARADCSSREDIRRSDWAARAASLTGGPHPENRIVSRFYGARRWVAPTPYLDLSRNEPGLRERSALSLQVSSVSEGLVPPLPINWRGFPRDERERYFGESVCFLAAKHGGRVCATRTAAVKGTYPDISPPHSERAPESNRSRLGRQPLPSHLHSTPRPALPATSRPS